MTPRSLVESTDFWSGERERGEEGGREEVFNVTRLSVAKRRTGGKWMKWEHRAFFVKILTGQSEGTQRNTSPSANLSTTWYGMGSDFLPPSLGYCFCSVLNTEAACSSETSLRFYQTTWHHIPDDILLSHCCENLRYCLRVSVRWSSLMSLKLTLGMV